MRWIRSISVATCLLAGALVWHGILAVLPHSHHGNETPRYAANCTLPGSDSPVSHLHTISRLLDNDICLTCLVAGSSAGIRPDCRQSLQRDPGTDFPFSFTTTTLGRLKAPLQDNRGPPLVL